MPQLRHCRLDEFHITFRVVSVINLKLLDLFALSTFGLLEPDIPVSGLF